MRTICISVIIVHNARLVAGGLAVSDEGAGYEAEMLRMDPREEMFGWPDTGPR